MLLLNGSRFLPQQYWWHWFYFRIGSAGMLRDPDNFGPVDLALVLWQMVRHVQFSTIAEVPSPLADYHVLSEQMVADRFGLDGVLRCWTVEKYPTIWIIRNPEVWNLIKVINTIFFGNLYCTVFTIITLNYYQHDFCLNFNRWQNI